MNPKLSFSLAGNLRHKINTEKDKKNLKAKKKTKDCQCVIQVTQVQCPPPENPRYGNAVFTSVGYNSVVSYECKHGYTIVGVGTRRCGSDRRWTGQTPTCKEINCGSPGILYNGWIDNIEAGIFKADE